MFERLTIRARTVPGALVVVLGLAARSTNAGAQTVAEYKRHVDSLAALWKSTTAAVAAQTPSAASKTVPLDTLRVGPVRVRADRQYLALAQVTAARLEPVLRRAYGRGGELIDRHVFVLRAKEGSGDSTAAVSAIADSVGDEHQRSSDIAQSDALLASWTRKAEEAIVDDIPGLREWIGAVVPVAPPSDATWSEARVALILSGSVAANECVAGKIERCNQVLGLTATPDPAFELYSADERRSLIERNARILRRADPAQFDRCLSAEKQPACDSLARQIPADAVPAPTNGDVRQSFVRFALARGGEGAFDRFIAPGSPQVRIASAARMPADSVVRLWQARVGASRRSSTALDMETALSALAWAGVCAGLALRSSRWR